MKSESGAAAIVAQIRCQIERGETRKGDKLPAPDDIAARYDCTLAVANQALVKLQALGLIHRRPGAGAFYGPKPFRRKYSTIACVGFNETSHDGYWRALVGGINDRCTEAMYGIAHPSPHMLADWLDRVDGVLLHGNEVAFVHPRIVEAKPCVGVNRNSTQFPCVLGDDYLGALDTIEYLVSKGHSRIAMMHFKTSPYALIRRAGWDDGLRGAGIEPDPTWCRVLSYYDGVPVTPDHGVMEMDKWLNSGFLETGCTAIVAQNDVLAFGIMRALQSRGLRVPDDVSVVGWDGGAACEGSYPPLTSVELPLSLIGRRAVEILDRMIEGDALEPEATMFTGKVVERQSVALRHDCDFVHSVIDHDAVQMTA